MVLRPLLPCLCLLASPLLRGQVTLLKGPMTPIPAPRAQQPRPPSAPTSSADLARLRGPLAATFQVSEALIPMVVIPAPALSKPGDMLTLDPAKPLPAGTGMNLYRATFTEGASTGPSEPGTIHGEPGATLHFWVPVPGKGSYLMTMRVATNLTAVACLGEEFSNGQGTMGPEHQVPVVNGRVSVAYDVAHAGAGRLGLGVGFGAMGSGKWCQVLGVDFIRIK